MGISEWLRCTFEPRFVQISSSSSIASAFYEVQYGRRLLCWICWVKLWDHPRRPIYGRWISRLNIFVMISVVMFKLKVFEYFCRSRLKVLFMHPKFQFLGIWLPKFREHHSRKAHLWADWRVLSPFQPQGRRRLYGSGASAATKQAQISASLQTSITSATCWLSEVRVHVEHWVRPQQRRAGEFRCYVQRHGRPT